MSKLHHKQQFVAALCRLAHLSDAELRGESVSGLVDGLCQEKVGITFLAISFIYAVFLCLANRGG